MQPSSHGESYANQQLGEVSDHAYFVGSSQSLIECFTIASANGERTEWRYLGRVKAWNQACLVCNDVALLAG